MHDEFVVYVMKQCIYVYVWAHINCLSFTVCEKEFQMKSFSLQCI